jgi:hypothetical protein
VGDIISVFPHGGGGGGVSANYHSPPGLITTEDRWSGIHEVSYDVLNINPGWADETAYLVPFVPPEDMTIKKMALLISVSDGNCDIGLYDAAFDRLASAGSTAVASAGMQSFDIADTALTAGSVYYAAFATDSTTMRVLFVADSVILGAASGTVIQASGFPLPASVTAATAVSVSKWPVIGMSTLATYS